MNISKASIIFIIILLIPISFLLYFIHFRGFISYDDGWFLYDGLRLLEGEKIYKDFHYLYNPGSLYLNALAFKLFGVSVFASRIMAYINSLVSIVLIFLISKKMKLNSFITSMLIFSYIFWGPGHINFVWPVMFCLTLALGCGTLFIYSENKRRNIFLFLIGVLSASVFILKQNFGLAIILTNIFFLAYQKEYRNRTSLMWFCSGYSVIIVIQLFYFIATNTLGFYLYEFYDYTIVKIFQQHILDSSLPWEFPAPFINKLAKLFLYLSPLLLCCVTIIKMIKEKTTTYLYFPVVGISFYLLSIRPTTDFIHLTPLISLALIPLFILYQETKEIKLKIVLFLVIIFCFFAGVYSAFYRNYYRWATPLIKQRTYVGRSTLKIFTDAIDRDSITQISDYYEKNTKNEKYTFIYYFTPAYYLILNKKNPTTYDDLQLGGVSEKDQKQIVKILNEKKVNHIMTDRDISMDTGVIARFIKINYIPVKQINGCTIWQRKNSFFITMTLRSS